MKCLVDSVAVPDILFLSKRDGDKKDLCIYESVQFLRDQLHK